MYYLLKYPFNVTLTIGRSNKLINKIMQYYITYVRYSNYKINSWTCSILWMKIIESVIKHHSKCYFGLPDWIQCTFSKLTSVSIVAFCIFSPRIMNISRAILTLLCYVVATLHVLGVRSWVLLKLFTIIWHFGHVQVYLINKAALNFSSLLYYSFKVRSSAINRESYGALFSAL